MIRERNVQALPGIPVLLVLLAVIGLLVWQLVEAVQDGATLFVIACVIGLVLCLTTFRWTTKRDG